MRKTILGGLAAAVAAVGITAAVPAQPRGRGLPTHRNFTRATNVIRGLVGAVAVTFAMLGLSVPAWADDPNGTYTVTWSDGSAPTLWTFTSCGPGCSHVTGNSGWTTDAHLVNGRWVMGPVHHTSVCADGSAESDTANGSFDAVTLSGASFVTYPVGCRESPPNGLTVRFQLTRSR